MALLIFSGGPVPPFTEYVLHEGTGKEKKNIPAQLSF